MESKKLYRQCFRPNHFVSECFRKGCKECGGKHHTLLHRSSTKSTLGTEQKLEKDQVEPKESREASKPTSSTLLAACSNKFTDNRC